VESKSKGLTKMRRSIENIMRINAISSHGDFCYPTYRRDNRNKKGDVPFSGVLALIKT